MMQKTIYFIWAFLLPLALGSQEIFLSTLDNRLFRLDLDDCSYEQVGTVPNSSTDISFHPNGNLYSINSSGRLFQVDPSIGTGTLVHVFESNPTQLYTSLTADANGVFYACGLGGSLWAYDLANNTGSFLGNVGYGAEGDLTFYQGDLYMAAPNDRIIKIDLENPANSTVFINGNVPGRIFGIVSYAADCEDVSTYALTDNAASVYLIDFENATLSLYCSIPLSVSGGASTYEFWASQPIDIQALDVSGFACADSSGRLSVAATGGAGALSYSLDGENYQVSPVFTNLPLADYTVYVQDELGCTLKREVSIAIDAPQITQAVANPASCGLANGSISLSAAGGSPPYAIALNGAAPQAGLAVSGLAPGTYQVSVLDAEGCTAAIQLEITDAGQPSLAELNPQATTCGEDNGRITISVEGGALPLSFAFDGGSPQSSGVFSSLPAGDYTLIISDANGCLLTAMASVAPSAAVVLERLEWENASCGLSNGSLQLEASGGRPPFRYAPDGSNFSAANVFTDLPAGDYTPTAIDADGCTATLALRLLDTEPPSFTDYRLQAAECNEPNGSISFGFQGGAGPLLFRINNQPQPLSSLLTGLQAGVYQLEISDSLGCLASLELVLPRRNCPVFLPNAFSPNRDGRNDLFYPQATGGLDAQVARFLIFDRWGGLAFACYDLPFGDPAAAWDGQRQGKDAPAGIYVYTLDLAYPDGEAVSIAGEVLLVR